MAENKFAKVLQIIAIIEVLAGFTCILFFGAIGLAIFSGSIVLSISLFIFAKIIDMLDKQYELLRKINNNLDTVTIHIKKE